MLTRIGMCGVVVLFLLSSAEVKAADPTEDQTQTRDECDDKWDEAKTARASCVAAQTSASAAQSAYNAVSKTHLTPGEQDHCDSSASGASSAYSDAQDIESDGMTYYSDANDAHFDGDNHWNSGEYAAACVDFEDAIDLYGDWAACNFQMADDDYAGAAESWSEAKEVVDEAANDSDCLLCKNPDAECDCLE